MRQNDIVAALLPANQNLRARLRELVDEHGADAEGDWRGQAALELADAFVSGAAAELPLTDDDGSSALNFALYRISYEASLACEYARQAGARAYRPEMPSASDRESAAERLHRRLELAQRASGREPEPSERESVRQLAPSLCLGLIDAFEARDRYDYPAMRDAIQGCDVCLPRGCTIETFRVLQAVKLVADAGLSRGGAGGTAPDLPSLSELVARVARDRDSGAGPDADHALLVMVTALGHMERSVLVADVLASRQQGRTSLADWLLETLDAMESRGAAAPTGWPAGPGGREANPVAHHLHFYRYFAHHVRATSLTQGFGVSAGEESSVSPEEAVAQVRKEYSCAATALEQALRTVPPTNEQRWRYYDLSAENLEHEESLRIALLEQQLTTRRIVRELAESSVRRYAEEAREELGDRMADVSMRIVEIIGVFLAVIAILGATIASAAVGELSLTGRILLLGIGGAMPVVYFLLLRLIVTGSLSRRWRRAPRSHRPRDVGLS